MGLKPIMPWMGSKRQLTKQLLARVPSGFRAYHEPFLGSGAMLYALQPAIGYASDELKQVIDLHKAVAEAPDALVAAYTKLASGCDRKTTFLNVRNRFPDIEPSEFLFLMKNCHGSRYRVNQAGKFNSPFNVSSLKSAVPSEREIAADQKALADIGKYSCKVDFAAADYSERLHLVKSGDFVFLDPPYQWKAGAAPDYGGQWGPKEWRRMMGLLSKLPDGVNIMITLHGSMPREEVEEMLAVVPRMRAEAISLTNSHLKKGGMQVRQEWLAVNYEM